MAKQTKTLGQLSHAQLLVKARKLEKELRAASEDNILLRDQIEDRKKNHNTILEELAQTHRKLADARAEVSGLENMIKAHELAATTHTDQCNNLTASYTDAQSIIREQQDRIVELEAAIVEQSIRLTRA